jgi:hypothetical protein
VDLPVCFTVVACKYNAVVGVSTFLSALVARFMVRRLQAVAICPQPSHWSCGQGALDRQRLWPTSTAPLSSCCSLGFVLWSNALLAAGAVADLYFTTFALWSSIVQALICLLLLLLYSQAYTFLARTMAMECFSTVHPEQYS